ncbi:MAG: DUF302 domain-containing protein [Gammaproteobacteria bacterium]|nr:MAG: DUF302 domain-containing protein [Gammaproteobacteria bacterium]
MKKIILICLLVMAGAVTTAFAENLLMARSNRSFEVTLEVAKDSIAAHGYTVSHIQRCDGGLEGFGYVTDKYRVIFFGKPDEVRSLSEKYPHIIPFLPLKIAVYAEEDETLAAMFNPEEFSALFTEEELRTQFSRWKSDFVSILDDIRKQQLVIGSAQQKSMN